MKPRLTIATVTVLSLLGLILLGFLWHDTYEGKANAQRIRMPADEQTLTPIPAEARQANVTTNGGSWQLGASSSDPYSVQPPRGLSVPSSHPIVIDIKNGPELSGELVDLSAFNFKTIFGLASIPVNTIVGMRMADDPRQPATICLANGDSLTGVLTTESVTIKTSWGGATIGRDHIVSIVTTTDPVTWQPDGDRGKITVTKPEASESEGEDQDARIDEAHPADQPPALVPDPAPTPSTSLPPPATEAELVPEI
jgi:hypothetical protein